MIIIVVFTLQDIAVEPPHPQEEQPVSYDNNMYFLAIIGKCLFWKVEGRDEGADEREDEGEDEGEDEREDEGAVE